MGSKNATADTPETVSKLSKGKAMSASPDKGDSCSVNRDASQTPSALKAGMVKTAGKWILIVGSLPVAVLLVLQLVQTAYPAEDGNPPLAQLKYKIYGQ